MLESIQNILLPANLLMMNIGILVGILIGAAPGLSVSFAVTILLTMTFHMDSLAAMFLLLGAYCGGMYGGSITATLINTPGTANAVCTAMEGYPLSRKGRAGDALRCSLVSSTIGGLISCIALAFFAPLLAKAIVNVASPEYFALCCFGIFASRHGKIMELNEQSPVARPGGDAMRREILTACIKYSLPVVVSSDGHFIDKIGVFQKSIALLEELHFPEELILNADEQRFIKVLAQKRHKP